MCYGYKVLKKLDANGEPIRGDREIIPEEADTIRRIFKEFASGKSPKAIAVDLNREGIPGPLGRAWGDTSIRGHASRGTGVVNNELYAGVLVWNRLRFIKDPSTGKRVSRINPESAWIRTEVPHLRIVDDELWNAARARQKQISAIFGPNPANTLEGRMKRVHLANRPVHLLSGLLTCGCCGGKIGIITPNRYACLNHHRRGTCDNGRTITCDKIEARVLIWPERAVGVVGSGRGSRPRLCGGNEPVEPRPAHTGVDRQEDACQGREGHCRHHRGHRGRHVSAEHESPHGRP